MILDISILLSAFIFILFGLVIVFSKEKYFIPILKINITKFNILFLLALVLFGIFFKSFGFEFLFKLLVSIFIFGAFIAGLGTDRKYLYISSLAFLILTGIFFGLGCDMLTEYTSILWFLFLTFGVIRDIFYAKIIKE